MTIEAVKGGEAALFFDDQLVCFESIEPAGAVEGRVDDSEQAICGGPIPHASRILPGLELPRLTIKCRPTFNEMRDIYLPFLGFAQQGDNFYWNADASRKAIWINYRVKGVNIPGAVVDKATLVAQRGGMPALLTMEVIGTRTIVNDPKAKSSYGDLKGGTPIPFTGGANIKVGLGTPVSIDVNRAVLSIDNHAVPHINAARYPDEINYGGFNTMYFGFGQSAGENQWALNEIIRANPGDVSGEWGTVVGSQSLKWTFPALDEPTILPGIAGKNDDLDFPHYMKCLRSGLDVSDQYFATCTIT